MKGRRDTRRFLIGAVLVLFVFPSAVEAQQDPDFFTLTPCRVYDTRWGQGPLAGGFDRHIPIGGYCGIPPDAGAVSFNFTVINPSGTGLLSAYPCCSSPFQNIIQGVKTGRTLAGNAVLGLGPDGKIGAFVSAPFSTTTDLAIDVSGYFRPTAPVQQWQEWEQALLSPADYTLNGGDPYSEVELDVRFTNAATGLTFLQPAFWDDEDSSHRVFRVRTALPAGNWTWQIASCTRNGVSCLAGWAPNQGSIFVQSNTATGNPLYDRGFVEQVETVAGGQLAAISEPVFPDGTKFDWLGDTAWAAPAREIDLDGPGPKTSHTSVWNTYIADRKAKGFTVIQIAPAVAWQPKPTDRWFGLPAADGHAFFSTGKPGCTGKPIPTNGCWTANGQYWKRFKNMVKQANDAKLLVVVVGVMNPVGIDPDEVYPDLPSARKFTRELVARLGSAAVMYSPAFDDDPGDSPSRLLLMNEVGNLLKAIVPKPIGPGKRRALSNLLAGAKSTCDEYNAIAQEGWMTHYLFQSGHGGAGEISPDPCHSTGANPVERAMERARVMPLTLTSYTPKLPAINGEGPYDNTEFADEPPDVDDVDIRYRIRQAGYLSTLSNAIGFTYGAYGLTLWDRPTNGTPPDTQPGVPASYFSLASANDMMRLKANFQSRGLLVSHPEWIKNNPTAQKYKMVLATNEVSFVTAYLPGDEGGKGGSSDTIKIDVTKLPCQVCPSQNGTPWSFTWVNPVNNVATPVGSGSCSGPVAGQLTFKRPDCVVTNQNCDWLLKLERTTTTCPSATAATVASSTSEGWSNTEALAEAGPTTLEVWSDTSPDDGTSAVYAAVRGPSGPEEPVLLSPAGKAFQVAPRVGRMAGHDLVAWQADGLDGSLYGIYGALLSPRGEIIGPFKINHYTEHDQREPAVVGGVLGKALVVWSSYGQDGDRGGIFGRLVSVAGQGQNDPLESYYLGEEFEIAEEREGHQQRPQVLADAGGFWVAWETVDKNGLNSTLSLRRLGMDGKPESEEVRLPAEPGEQRKLLTLDSPTPESVVMLWWRQDARGDLLEPLQQDIGPYGPLGPVQGQGLSSW